MSDGPLVVSAHALDTGAGDGVVADAGVFLELDCAASCVVTSVLPPEPLPRDVVARQLDRASRLGPIGAVRVGFLHGEPQAELLAEFVRRVAPESAVMAATLRAGTELLIDAKTQNAIVRHLYPVARVLVARAVDLPSLMGRGVDGLNELRGAAKRLKDQGARAVVISGLLSRGRMIDLVDDGGDPILLDTSRIHAPHVAGLAGSYAAALAAHLARGLPLRDAAEAAQRYIGFRIQRGR